ncbi:hypothetical protein WOLCODRAFT_157692 [Wolfiporia cocos MD-104 SS10]|uniref:Uncharacterized protein n=1 Tax=Wolfiporia cocos (strain MD-104) TaxID=742152 RepID=A0A2H3JGY8_WOLCO|nr:hypothetical protein WOLCODRAFT_157692 [Wolfiporia cocos MD-104 SS10]
MGTWKDFAHDLTRLFGRKMDTELAREEINQYFGTKGWKKADADFPRYAEQFGIIARRARLDNKELLNELAKTLPDRLLDAFNVLPLFKKEVPKQWEEFLHLYHKTTHAGRNTPKLPLCCNRGRTTRACYVIVAEAAF